MGKLIDEFMSLPWYAEAICLLGIFLILAIFFIIVLCVYAILTGPDDIEHN